MKSEKIIMLLNTIAGCLKILQEETHHSLQEYKSDRRLQDIVEREFERLIHACIDIGARIISLKNLPKASTYTEIFDILTQENILSPKLSEQMKDMVRFRNIICHEYFKIEPEIVYSKLKLLHVFTEFCREIEKAGFE
jgi:uncharacterized protein YutE (UPF0331/DUF86 family)